MTEGNREREISRVAVALGLYLLILFGVFTAGAFAVAGVAWLLNRYTDVGSEVVLPILLIYGVVTLLVALAALVGILSSFGLTDRKFALGLPEGSIQAVIALTLVLIFAITAVFLSTLDIGGPDGVVTERFATQVLTTTGTLAVAVAGFYFGTRAVETGAETARAVGAGPRSVRVVSPTSPASLSKEKGAALAIAIATVPPEGAALSWRVSGDDDGELLQIRPGQFEYRRGSSPQDEVTVRFELKDDPSASAELKIQFPPPARPAEPA